jgi:hypothetical protein
MIHFVGSSSQKLVTDAPAFPQIRTRFSLFVVYQNWSGGSFIGHDAVNGQLLWTDTQFFVNTDDSVIAFTGGAKTSTSKLFIATLDYVGKSFAVYLDGVARGSSTDAGTTQLNAGNMILGNGYAALTADMGEIGVYDRILTGDEITALTNGLKAKWGIV